MLLSVNSAWKYPAHRRRSLNKLRVSAHPERRERRKRSGLSAARSSQVHYFAAPFVLDVCTAPQFCISITSLVPTTLYSYYQFSWRGMVFPVVDVASFMHVFSVFCPVNSVKKVLQTFTFCQQRTLRTSVYASENTNRMPEL